jgi:pyrroloquinoline quinone (PQQ) biosynthesis protein C
MALGLGTRPTESRRLRNKLELVLPVLLATGRRLIASPALDRLYPEYLELTHGMVRASVPLMETALSRARALPDDPVAERLADYLEHHIPEERGHDEWLLEDLEFLGIPRVRVLGRVPSPTIAALVGAQYYWMLHTHPVALLGYIALLEGYPPRPEDLDLMQVTSGYPAEAFRTLRLHADLDPHHGEELDELLDALPVDESQRTLMGLSAITSVQLCAQALQEVLDRA